MAGSHKPESWTSFPWRTSWAAQWHSLLSVRRWLPWTLPGLIACGKTPKPKTGLSPRRPRFPGDASEVCMPTVAHQFSLLSPPAPAWCLRSEGVSSVLLGVSSAEQLIEHLGALQVSRGLRHSPSLSPSPNSQGLAVQPVMGLGGQPLQSPRFAEERPPERQRARQGRG